MTQQQIREEAKQAFLEHTVNVIENTKNVQVFKFQKPGTWVYGFQLVCADNMICVTGDVYSMLVEPGYGRSGLAWMRGSINSESYFLEKIRITDQYEEFCQEKAAAFLKDRIKEVQDELNDSLEGETDEGEIRLLKNTAEEKIESINDIPLDVGPHKFLEECHELELFDETPNVMKLSSETLYQLEGLRAFCRKLDEMNFLIGETK